MDGKVYVAWKRRMLHDETLRDVIGRHQAYLGDLVTSSLFLVCRCLVRFFYILIVLASRRKVEFDQMLARLIHFVAGGTFLAGFFKAMLQTMRFKTPFDAWSLNCKYSTARAWLLYHREKKMSFNLRLSSACIVHLRTAKNFIKPKKV